MSGDGVERRSFGPDFRQCEKWHKCGEMHGDMEEVKSQLDSADTKRDTMENTLGDIAIHLKVGNERFKWLERAGWLLGAGLFLLVSYMITMSIVFFNRDANRTTTQNERDTQQNISIIKIEKDVSYIVKAFRGNGDD